MANEDDPTLSKIFACFDVRPIHKDDKNRINIPAKMRGDEENEFSEYLLVRNMMEGCLFLLFPPSQIAKLSDQEVKSLAAISCPIHLDKSGRILIPKAFERASTDEAGITNLVMVGRANHFELWTREKWAEIETQRKEEAKKVVAHLLNDNI